MLYSNQYALPILKDIYSKVKEFKTKDLGYDGDASITYTFEINGTTYGGGVELKLINPQIYTGREWIVDFIY